MLIQIGWVHNILCKMSCQRKKIRCKQDFSLSLFILAKKKKFQPMIYDNATIDHHIG